jgi:hypothetical protein
MIETLINIICAFIPSKKLRKKLRQKLKNRNLILIALPLKFKKTSYSQEGEDMILSNCFQGKKNGFYVDIGALHPFRFSNTQTFYKKGWHGINIDATPGSMNLFKKFRKRDINLEIGVGEKESEMSYYLFDEPALNTFSKERSDFLIKNTNHNLILKKKIKILPLNKILDKHLKKNQKIDFMTIDVEGMDIVILKTNNWKKYSPKYLLVELLNLPIEDIIKSDEYAFIKSKGYTLIAKTERTMIFERKK